MLHTFPLASMLRARPCGTPLGRFCVASMMSVRPCRSPSCRFRLERTTLQRSLLQVPTPLWRTIFARGERAVTDEKASGGDREKAPAPQKFTVGWMEEIIQEAMRRGEFDNLPGKGKPLDLRKDEPDP